MTPDNENNPDNDVTGNADLTGTVRRLAQMLAESRLSELTVEEGGLTITVKAAWEAVSIPAGALSVPAHPHVLPLAQSPPYSQTAVTTPTAPAAAKPARAATLIALESPMVGVFYRSPTPDDPPFVVVGDHVKVGQTIGLIEAMKVYSEVPSEAAGRVVEMPVESGKLVQQGQPLIFVETA